MPFVVAGTVRGFLDEQVRILEAEIQRGFVVALLLALIAAGLFCVATFGHASEGPAMFGIPASVFSRLVPGACACLSAASTTVPLKLITPVRQRISTLKTAKTLGDEELKEMFLKAAEKAMQPGGVGK
jgi:hypothetical protein